VIRRLLVIAAVIAVLVFAIQGGEYGTSDLLKQRTRRKAVVARLDSLQRQVDSLTRRKRALQYDAALQERIAREEFGMIRGGKEILYRFADPDSGK
jgi:cell division protein FtsB